MRQSPPVTPRWHCSGFSRAGAVPDLAGRLSGGRKLGPRESRLRVPAFGNPRDAPATYLSPQRGRGGRDAPAAHSRLQSQHLRRALGTGGCGPKRAGAGRAGRGGAVGGGACGLRAPNPEVPAGLHTVRGSAQPARSSQVRMPRLGRGGPGTAGLGAGEGQEPAGGARRLSQAQRPTLLR